MRELETSLAGVLDASILIISFHSSHLQHEASTTLVTTQISSDLYAYQTIVLRELECPSLALNGTSAHVHILFVLSRTARLCDVVEKVKKRSSKWIKTNGDE